MTLIGFPRVIEELNHVRAKLEEVEDLQRQALSRLDHLERAVGYDRKEVHEVMGDSGAVQVERRI